VEIGAGLRPREHQAIRGTRRCQINISRYSLFISICGFLICRGAGALLREAGVGFSQLWRGGRAVGGEGEKIAEFRKKVVVIGGFDD